MTIPPEMSSYDFIESLQNYFELQGIDGVELEYDSTNSILQCTITSYEFIDESLAQQKEKIVIDLIETYPGVTIAICTKSTSNPNKTRVLSDF